MKERIVWLMVITICLSGYVLTANAAITVGEDKNALWTGGSAIDVMSFSWTPGEASCLVVTVQGAVQKNLSWVTGITFGPTNEVFTQAIASAGTNKETYSDIWYLVGPAPTSGDITVTMNADPGSEMMVIGAVILHGVHQTSPLVAGTPTDKAYKSNAANISATVDADASGILINSVERNGGSSTKPAPLTGQTLIYRESGLDGGGTGAAGYRKITAAGETTETWSVTSRATIAVASFAPDLSFNPPPEVDAGPDQEIWWPDTHTVTLAGTATDMAPGGVPGTITSLYWVHTSGPGTVMYDPDNLIVNPTATFSDPGIHELMLQVSDGLLDANDTMTVIALPPQLVGHWPFDNDALDASINSNDGTLAEVERGYPKYDTDSAVGTHSISLADPNGTEPNQPHIALGAATELDFSTTDWTISAWIKTTRSGQSVIFGNGGDYDNGTRIGLYNAEGSSGKVEILTDDNEAGGSDPPYGKNYARADKRTDDGNWHFVLGLRDGTELRIYRDGVHDDTQAVPADYDLSGTSAWPSYIGRITDARDDTLAKQFRGLIDDVRIYNYALDDPNILLLAAMGELPPMVNAGPDSSFRLQPNEDYTTAASVIDNGNPVGNHTYLWTCIGRPNAGPEDANAIFTDAELLNTTVVLPYFGVYTLRLTVTDDAPATSVGDNVVLTLISSTCPEVPANLVGDISGPGGGDVPDCYVDLYDIARFAAEFMRCNDPEDLLTCELAALIPLP